MQQIEQTRRRRQQIIQEASNQSPVRRPSNQRGIPGIIKLNISRSAFAILKWPAARARAREIQSVQKQTSNRNTINKNRILLQTATAFPMCSIYDRTFDMDESPLQSSQVKISSQVSR